MSAGDVLDKDLRVLPSPLGDLLFETLTRGRLRHPQPRCSSPCATCPSRCPPIPVMGDGTEPLGRSARVRRPHRPAPARAWRSRAADQLQLLTRVVARIADEIKNPLVSINAFMELIGERYDDPSFRHQFPSVVGRDVRRLVQIFDKLAALVNEGDYKRDVVDIRVDGRRVPGRDGRPEMPALPTATRVCSASRTSRHRSWSRPTSPTKGPVLRHGGPRHAEEGHRLPDLVPAPRRRRAGGQDRVGRSRA